MPSERDKESECLNPTPHIRPDSPNQVECTNVETLYNAFFKVNRYTLSHQTFAGGKTPFITREVFERGHAVAILPYDPISDRIILIEQFRAGAMVAGWHPWLIEIPAGMIELGEDPEEVARRETQEETGLEAGRLEFIAHSLCSPGGCSETLALYCVEVNAENAPETAGLEHEHEDIRVFSISAAEAIALLSSKSLNNASTIMALQWFALNHDNLRTQWLGKV